MKNLFAFYFACVIVVAIAQNYAIAQLTPAQEFRNRMRELLKPQILQTSCDVEATQAIIRCRVYFPSPLIGPTGGEQGGSEVRLDTSTIPGSYIIPLIGLRIPVFINGCRSLTIFRKNTDSVFTVQTVLSGLRPGTTYYLRLWQTVSYLNFDVEQTDGSPFSSDSVFMQITTASISRLPTFLPISSIVSNGFTLRWIAPNQLQALCTLELSTDMQFQTVLQSRTVQPTDSIRFTGLTPNTSYFYRLRVKSGNIMNDIVGESPVRTVSGAAVTATQMPLYTFLEGIPRPYTFPQELFRYYCVTDARYYRYRKNERLSLAESETLLQNLITRGIAFDSAWVQSNTTCKSDSAGISEFIVKVPRENPQMDMLGFSLGHTDWAGLCECRQFRIYTKLTPSSIDRNTFTGNIKPILFPNPVTNFADIQYFLLSPASVYLEVLDMLGRTALPTITEERDTGEQSIPFSVEGLSSGVYSVRLTIRTVEGVRTETVRLVVVR
jgi:hypothetical protein